MCRCYFCVTNKKHPTNHTSFMPISDKLLKAESLDPKDSVKQFACETCGHVVESPNE